MTLFFAIALNIRKLSRYIIIIIIIIYDNFVFSKRVQRVPCNPVIKAQFIANITIITSKIMHSKKDSTHSVVAISFRK